MTKRQAVVFPAVSFYVSVISNLPRHMRSRIHLHPHYELMWLSRKEATFFHDFNEYPLQAGSLAFVAPGQLHTWFGDWDAFELRVVGFSPSIFTVNGMVDNFAAEFPFFQPGARPVYTPNDSQAPLFYTLFETVYTHFKEHGQAVQPLLVSYLTTLLMEADRLYDSPTKAMPQTAGAYLTRRFQSLVEQRFAQRLKVQTYAAELSITTNHLVKTVRQTLGITPGRLIQERLLLEAKRLLVHSDQPAAEIAYQLNFSSPTQFGNWFTKMEHCSPGQFRQKFKVA